MSSASQFRETPIIAASPALCSTLGALVRSTNLGVPEGSVVLGYEPDGDVYRMAHSGRASANRLSGSRRQMSICEDGPIPGPSGKDRPHVPLIVGVVADQIAPVSGAC